MENQRRPARLLQQRDELEHVQLKLHLGSARLPRDVHLAAAVGPGEGGLDVARAELRGRGLAGLWDSV